MTDEIEYIIETEIEREFIGERTVTKATLGLGNVDNTSDADKPVSTAQQEALDTKQNTFVEGDNITIDNTDPLNPVISATGGGSGGAVQELTHQTAVPAAPSAGISKLYVKEFGTSIKGKAELAILNEDSDFAKILETRLADKWICFAQPQINSATLAVYGFGGLNAQVGSFAAGGNIGTLTNLYASMPKVLARSNAAAGNRFEVVQVGNAHQAVSDGSFGGFDTTFRFGISLLPAGMRGFVGLTGSVYNASNALSTLLSCVGIGFDPNDANLKLIQNNNTPTAVITDLGANFPANTTLTDVYQLRIVNKKNVSGKIFVELRRLNVPAQAPFIAELNSRIPVAGSTLNPMIGGWNNATASMAEIAIFEYYCQREF
jgi:hypothetical protein